MEGVGSRLGRASSRYGPAATVFNGPVRKWKKKWVHVSSSSSSSTVSYQSNGHNNGSSRLLLCRWTPLPPTTTASSDGSGELGSGSGGGSQLDEPPRRKFRYTPVSKTSSSTTWICFRVYELWVLLGFTSTDVGFSFFFFFWAKMEFVISGLKQVFFFLVLH